jgi:hypothetical protein
MMRIVEGLKVRVQGRGGRNAGERLNAASAHRAAAQQARFCRALISPGSRVAPVRLPDDRPLPGTWERDERAVAWVYGSILVAAAVVVATDVIASKPGQILLYTAATMVVVWLAHSYAAFVGHGGRVDVAGVGARVRYAMSTELAVLASASPTLIAIAACWLVGAGVTATGLVGLIVSIATMALVTGGIARRAGAGRFGVVAAAVGALLLGGLLVAAKVALK